MKCEVIQTVGPMEQCLAYSIDDWKTATLMPPGHEFEIRDVDIVPGWTRRYRAAQGQAAGPPDEVGSCYFCLDSYPRSRIDDYEVCEGDAICPSCGVDAVSFAQHTPESLRKLRSETWPELYTELFHCT